MSESSIPFAGGDTAVAEPLGIEPEAPTTDRTKLLAVGGVAVALVLAVAAYFLLFAGGGAEETADPGSGGSESAVVPPSDTAPAEAAPTTEKISAKSFGRDPFKAGIVEAPPVVEQSPVDPATTGSTGSTTDGTASLPGATTETGTSTPTVTTSHSFRVVSVAPDNSTITVKVDGEQYDNLRAGEVFATFFKVRLISGTTNAFQYGEERFNVLGTKRLTIA